MRYQHTIFVATIAILAACSPPDERDPDDPFVPTNANNGTANNVANNATTSTNNATTGTNNSNNVTNGGGDYGQYVVEANEDCEGIAGLNGAALLETMTTSLSVQMADLDPENSDHLNPRALDIVISWPDEPVLTCYPEYQEQQVLVQPRLGAEGLLIELGTADGEFSESMPGAVWLTSNNGTVGRGVAGSMMVSDMQGSWMPGPDVLFMNPKLSLFTTLEGNAARGNIAMSNATNEALSYGSFTGRQIVIEWPYVMP